MKNQVTGLFDVTVGSYDGREVCNLIGMFALSKLPKQYSRCDIGLYRANGLAVFRGMSGSMAEGTKKDINKYFNYLGLRITIQSNLKTVNFLDITLHQINGKYYPYHKPNDRPLYINRLSNHRTSILKHLTSAISRRLTHISHDTEVFREAVPLYNNMLRNSGFVDNVEYVESRKVKDLVQRGAK